MMEREKISVIVPVYKVEEWLAECVESIQKQTYENIEIILINDGSPDRSPIICDEFASVDNRIKVVHKENGGVSSARNLGIEVATGQYITFVDSDDYLDKDYLSVLYNNLRGCSISECGTICFDENGKSPAIRGRKRILGWEEYLTETNLNGFLSYAVVYAKLYDRELFSNVRFPIGRINGEDESTVYKIIYKGKKVSRVYDALYYYRQRSSGASQNRVSEKRINDTETFFQDKITFFYNMGRNDLVAFFSAKEAIAFIGLYKNSDISIYKVRCYKVISKLFNKFWNSGKVPIKYKVYVGAFLIYEAICKRV